LPRGVSIIISFMGLAIFNKEESYQISDYLSSGRFFMRETF